MNELPSDGSDSEFSDYSEDSDNDDSVEVQDLMRCPTTTNQCFSALTSAHAEATNQCFSALTSPHAEATNQCFSALTSLHAEATNQCFSALTSPHAEAPDQCFSALTSPHAQTTDQCFSALTSHTQTTTPLATHPVHSDLPTPASTTASVSLSPVGSISLVQALATLQSVLSQQLGTTNTTTRQGTSYNYTNDIISKYYA